MKIDFQDTLKKDAIDLSFSILGDDVERDIYSNEASIKWSLNLILDRWGVDKFNYELIEMSMPIYIDTISEEGVTDSTKVYAEVKYNSNKNSRGYICRIYEDVMKNDKWSEEEYAKFPIKVSVEEQSSTEEGGRSQVFVKYIELNLNGEEKTLILSI